MCIENCAKSKWEKQNKMERVLIGTLRPSLVIPQMHGVA